MQQKRAARPRGNYSTFRRFAYYLNDAFAPSQILWQAKFPTKWEQELCALSQYLPSKDNNWTLPYYSLGKVLLLTVPSGVTPGFDSLWINKTSLRAFITAGDTPPETEPITTIVRGWANFSIGQRSKFGGATYAEMHSQLNTILNGMSPSQLVFEKLNVDLPLAQAGPGVLEQNEGYYYKALPAWMVKQLQNIEFEIGDRKFKMIRAQRPNGNGLELVSWPPEPFGKGYLSLVLSFDVQTLPGKTDHPIVYPKMFVRRWVNKSLAVKNKSVLPSHQSTTVMVRTDVPWLPDLSLDSQALAAISIRSRKSANGDYLPIWDDNLPELLSAVGATPLVSAEEFAQSPVRFNTSPELACVLNSMIIGRLGKYPIGNGLFPGDLMILHEQVDAYLQQIGFLRVPDQGLEKITLARTNQNKKVISPDTTWQSLKAAIGTKKKIRFEVYYQSIQAAQKIWLEFVDAFGVTLGDGLDPFAPNGITVQSRDNLSLYFRAVLNEYETVEIGDGQDLQAAQDDLITKVTAKLPQVQPDSVCLSIIELKNYYSSKKGNERRRDAKRTLRYAFAKTDRLTQFMEPEEVTGNTEEREKAEATIKVKSHAAVLDIRRQMGFMENDLSEMLESVGLKPDTQLVGLHLEVQNVTRRSQKLNEKAVFFPAAVKVDVGEQKILSAAPDDKGSSDAIAWEPYYQSGLRLGSYSGNELHMGITDRVKGGSSAVERFVDQIIQIQNDLPTVIFVPANEWRYYWRWLQDKVITFDHMKLNSRIYLPEAGGLIGGNTRVSKNIRVIRYRFKEVPSYLTLDQSKELDSQAGYGHGICKIAERTYYSIARKPDSYQPSYGWSRFSLTGSGGYRENARTSALIEIVPAFLQPGDDPDVYARAFHLLRAAATHWVNGFTNHPLPAHLAKNLTEDYISMRSDINSGEDSEADEE